MNIMKNDRWGIGKPRSKGCTGGLGRSRSKEKGKIVGDRQDQ
jgi:hypothetical protein